MQVLDVPWSHVDVVVAISLKGATFLKNSRYRSRYKGAPDYYHLPHYGFVTKPQYKALFPQEPAKPKRRNTVPKPVVPRKPAAYTIDKKTVSHRILGFVNAMQGTKRLYLWTISFKEGTSDDTGFHLLRKWLQRMTTDEKLKHYCRVTERQKNGTIHFHIAINQYMDVKRANRYMRACMMRSVDNGELIMDRDDIMKYNGVDIAKNRKTGRVINFAKRKAQKSLSNYLAKYVSKNDSTWSQLAWHNSRTYSNVITHVHLSMAEYSKTLLQDKLQTDRPLDGEWFTFYRWKGPPPDTVQRHLAFVTNHIDNLNTIP